MKRVPTVENPELLDRIIVNMQQGLADNLPWLDVAFGRAERLVKYDERQRRVYTPNVYAGGNDYTEVTPDANIGNFCFFWVNDPQEITQEKGVSFGISTTFSVIFWLDYRKVLNANTRNREAVKRQIMDLFNGGFWLKGGRIEINRVYELAENIYKGFSLDEIDNQFLMQPYGGFRFEGNLSIGASCIL